jgi:hypothetical protein
VAGPKEANLENQLRMNINELLNRLEDIFFSSQNGICITPKGRDQMVHAILEWHEETMNFKTKEGVIRYRKERALFVLDQALTWKKFKGKKCNPTPSILRVLQSQVFPLTQEDWSLMWAYYNAHVRPDYRRSAPYLLFLNWNTELEKARRWKELHPTQAANSKYLNF